MEGIWQPTEEGQELLRKLMLREKDEGFQKLMDNVSTLIKNVGDLTTANKEIALRLVKLERREK